MKACALVVLACMATSAWSAKPLRGAAPEPGIKKADARQMRLLAGIEQKIAKRYEYEAANEEMDAAAIREEAANKAMFHLDRVNKKLTDMAEKAAVRKEEVTAGEAAADAAQIDSVAEADKTDAAATEHDAFNLEKDAAVLEKGVATAAVPKVIKAVGVKVAPTAMDTKKAAYTSTVPKATDTKKAADTSTVPKATDTKKAAYTSTVPKATDTKKAAYTSTVPKVTDTKKEADTHVVRKAMDTTKDAKVVPKVAVQFAKANAASDLKPIGEGAYQSHQAVMERTTSKDTHCEDAGLYKNEGKWNDCYHSDYVDAHKPYARAESGAVMAHSPLLATAMLVTLSAALMLP